MIQVKNLVRKFQTGGTELVVLKNLSFEVPTGQFLAITGRSGAGKSTLLYNVSLLDKSTEGTILIEGQNVADLDEKERVVYRRDHFGFIFQDYALLPTLTSIENVILPMLMQGIDRKTATAKGEEALIKAGIEGKEDNLPNQLSGGEQQRVSIARAIAHNPKILFADEPTANLDTLSSQHVLDTFITLNKEGQTIIMVTHELEYAKLADRDMELLDGKIIRDKKQKIFSKKGKPS
jgi:ABC-type lipoprotein export system ATPase subunit